MFRAVILTFHGQYKGGQAVDHHDPENHFHGDPAHPHESSWNMAGPLLVLTVPAIGAGFFAIDHTFRDFILGAIPHDGAHLQAIVEHIKEEKSFEWGIAIVSTAVAIAGIGLAFAMYQFGLIPVRTVRALGAPLAAVFENKWFFDRLYEDFFVVTVLQRGWNRLLELNDRYLVDGAVNGVGRLGAGLSARLRVIQTGQLQGYGLGFAAGIVVVVIAVFAANPL
jgi:NADH-quinone oxidoreductase subunit L